MILPGYNQDISKYDNKCELLSFETLKFKSIKNCLIKIICYGACEFENN